MHHIEIVIFFIQLYNCFLTFLSITFKCKDRKLKEKKVSNDHWRQPDVNVRKMSLVCIVFFAVIFSIQSTTVAAFSTEGPKKATVWDLFQWKIHIQRLQRDNIIVYGLSDTTVALDNIQIDSAKCDDPREGSGTNGQREFTIRCKCNELSSTFYNKSKSCVLNRRLKQGKRSF